MDRKKFLTTSFLGALGISFGNQVLGESHSFRDKSFKINQVGFNHLPQREEKTMDTLIHRADTRGHANHGWLNSHHSFSFANYYNPERMHFGALRVLNDDQVSPGMGFGTHPHQNMEIISIPLEGDLEHKDSMGNVAVIKSGDVQVMSAGTGIKHSEYNRSKEETVKFLQIWLFPKEENVKPRYDQISIREIEKENQLYQVLSPNVDDQGVWVHQDAWFYLGKFTQSTNEQYVLNKKENGVYLFVLEGEVEVAGEKLAKRDGMGLWNTASFEIEASPNSRLLVMEVPMNN